MLIDLLGQRRVVERGGCRWRVGRSRAKRSHRCSNMPIAMAGSDDPAAAITDCIRYTESVASGAFDVNANQ